jgi:hypothetical protein
MGFDDPELSFSTDQTAIDFRLPPALTVEKNFAGPLLNPLEIEMGFFNFSPAARLAAAGQPLLGAC